MDDERQEILWADLLSMKSIWLFNFEQKLNKI